MQVVHVVVGRSAPGTHQHAAYIQIGTSEGDWEGGGGAHPEGDWGLSDTIWLRNRRRLYPSTHQVATEARILRRVSMFVSISFSRSHSLAQPVGCFFSFFIAHAQSRSSGLTITHRALTRFRPGLISLRTSSKNESNFSCLIYSTPLLWLPATQEYTFWYRSCCC